MASTDDVLDVTRFLDIYPHYYVLRSNKFSECVQIDLISGKLSKDHKVPQDDRITSVQIRAVYGIVQLEKIKYLLVVTKSNYAANLYGKVVQQLSRIDFYPIAADQKVREEDKSLIEMMQSWFRTKAFYFSEEYDLTNSFQRYINNAGNKHSFNSAFCYNECFLQPFLQLAAYNWMTYFITGYVGVGYFSIDQLSFDYVLITRRDKRRAGLRYTQRGTDLDGNATNQAETEQIIVLNREENSTIYAYVQTRGSIPFLWSQKPNLRWSPSGVIYPDEQANVDVFKKHFADQFKAFPKQILVNLIDGNKPKSTQHRLGTYFTQLVDKSQLKGLRYEWFDFHHECRNMRWENLSRLMDKINEDLLNSGYFVYEYKRSAVTDGGSHRMQEGFVHRTQEAVVRTNCMDCLDRTNVVQSVIARKIMHIIIAEATQKTQTATGVFAEFPSEVEKIFRQNWTKNANVMSLLYSGTPAQKTDFTETGKRTQKGAIRDGVFGVQRYVYNNFNDAYKQDSLDILLGKIDPSKSKYKPPINTIPFVIALFFGLWSLLRAQITSLAYGDLSSNLVASPPFTRQIYSGLLSIIAIGVIGFAIINLHKYLVPKTFRRQ